MYFGRLKHQDGGLEEFSTDFNHPTKVDHRYQLTPNGEFTQWAELHYGYEVRSPCVAIDRDGTMHCFAINLSNRLVHTQKDTNPKTDWTPWDDSLLPAEPSPYEIAFVAVPSNMDGMCPVDQGPLVMFAATVEQVFLFKKNTDNKWSFDQQIGGNCDRGIIQLVAAVNRNGSQEVFIINDDYSIFHNYQRPDGKFRDWESISLNEYQVRAIAADANENGALELWGADLSGNLVRIKQSNWKNAIRVGWQGLDCRMIRDKEQIITVIFAYRASPTNNTLVYSTLVQAGPNSNDFPRV